MEFEDFSDDQIVSIPTAELYDDLIDLMLDMDMDAEGIDMAFNALETGDYDRLESIVPEDSDPNDVADIVALYIDYVNADLDEFDAGEGDVSEAVLSLSQRRKRAQTMRRFKNKLKTARNRMKKKAAPADVIQRRARRAAIKVMRTKVAGSRGSDYANLTPGEKAIIDKRVATRKTMIDRLAKRMVIKVRQADRAKLSRKPTNESKESDVDSFTRPFPVAGYEADDSNTAKPLGWTSLKKWHPHYRLNGQLDKRLKMNRYLEDEMDDADVSEAFNPNMITEAEIRGVDVQAIVEQVQLEMESAPNDDVVAETIARIAKAYNATEKLDSLLEQREPEYISEATGDSCAFITHAQIKTFEKLCDQLFKKFKIDFRFTRHFGERMSDGRNNPCLTLKELAEFIKKIYAESGKRLKDNKDTEVVLKDLQSDINIPVAIEFDRNHNELNVAMKTIMRKKAFRSPDKIVPYK